MILGNPGALAASQPGKNIIQHLAGRPGRFGVERNGRIVFCDLDSGLTHNIAVIGPGGHVMKRHPGLLFTIDQHPVDGNPTAIAGQQASVKVQASFGGEIQDGGAHQISIIKGKYHPGGEIPNLLNPEGMIDVFGGIHRNIFPCGQFGHGIKPDILLWIILVGEHGRNFKTVFQKRLDAGTADIVISQNNCFHK